MFHWDRWLPEGKGSHLFFHKIEEKEEVPTIEGNPKDITLNMAVNTPPLFTDKSNFDLSNDGSKVAFTAHWRNKVEAWKTGWQTFYLDLSEMSDPVCITKHTEARTLNPVFSNDDTKIGYLAMITPGLESENVHFEIYNIITNKVDIIDMSPIDKSVNSFMWHTDTILYFQATDIGVNTLYQVNIKDIAKPDYSKLAVESQTISYSLPFIALKNRNAIACIKVGYNYPDRVVIMNLLKQKNEGGSYESQNERELIYLNKESFAEVKLSEQIPIQFQNSDNETVYGWLFKPIDFDETKTYPIALLIHGGPEGSWSSGWSYGWNPQLWTNHGYAVIMINPHGSTGVTSDFLNAVRNDWGGKPFNDIITGFDYLVNEYKWLDKDRACAAGGSYGGYMINWIEGQTKNKFKCLVNHDGIFSSISMFYATEELWFPKAEFCTPENMGCNPFDSVDIKKNYEKFSPERFVNEWQTPMLIIHGGTDYRVPLTEGLSAFSGLQVKGVESKF